MKTFPRLIVCEHCDGVFQRPDLARGEIARCELCDAVLCRADRLSIDLWLALTVTAAIMFVLANVYPVIRISLGGMHNEATLWQSMRALAHGNAAPIAVPAALAAIFVPLMQILLLGWVLSYARFGQRAPGFGAAMKGLNHLRPWSMVEVCLLGALVTIVKLSGYLSVVAGVGIWATAALTVLLTIIASRDTHWLWETPARESA